MGFGLWFGLGLGTVLPRALSLGVAHVSRFLPIEMMARAHLVRVRVRVRVRVS